MAQLSGVEHVSDAQGGPSPSTRRCVLLTVHSALPGGAELLALQEAEHLKERYELLLSVPDGPLRASFARHGELVGGLATLPLWGASPVVWSKRLVRTLIDAVRTSRLIRRRSIELVLTNSSVSLAPVLAARLAGVPVLVHARDVPKSRLARLVFALHGALATCVIVITGELEPYFRRANRARVVRIADGIAIPPRPMSRPQGALSNPLRLCLVGGLDPRKGQDIAVQALAHLRELGVAASLELVGREIDVSFTQRVREEARSLGVADSVTFAGELSDARPNLARADIVIAPSRSEWTPLVLMEALAEGTPVIASRVGGVSDIVEDGRSGLLVDPEDPRQLAESIVRLACDPSAAALMARCGQEYVERTFSIERTLDGLGAEIELMLAQTGGADCAGAGDGDATPAMAGAPAAARKSTLA
jgi:glycosyltransferase involved in cell wall biosynthesis